MFKICLCQYLEIIFSSDVSVSDTETEQATCFRDLCGISEENKLFPS